MALDAFPTSLTQDEQLLLLSPEELLVHMSRYEHEHEHEQKNPIPPRGVCEPVEVEVGRKREGKRKMNLSNIYHMTYQRIG